MSDGHFSGSTARRAWASLIIVVTAAFGVWCGGSPDAGAPDVDLPEAGPDRAIARADAAEPEEEPTSIFATDVHNCGASGHDCAVCGGTSCVEGRCVPTVLAKNQAQPRSLRLEGGELFWANLSGVPGVPGTVAKIAVDGGGYQVLATAAGFPYALAVDATHVYFDNGSIGRVARDGSGLVDVSSVIGGIQDLAAGSNSVFWASYSQVGSIDQDGGEYVTAVGPSRPLSLALDDTSLYWVRSDGTVWKTPRTAVDTSPAQAIYTPAPEDFGPLADSIVVDATRVYWSGFYGVQAINKDGTVYEVLNLADARRLAMDEDHLYWTGGAGDTISVASKTRSPAKTIRVGEQRVAALAVDARCIYWTSTQGDVCAIVK
jgi:hypothetical protein